MLQVDAAVKLKAKIFFKATMVFVHSVVVLQLGAVKIEKKLFFTSGSRNYYLGLRMQLGFLDHVLEVFDTFQT